VAAPAKSAKPWWIPIGLGIIALIIIVPIAMIGLVAETREPSHVLEYLLPIGMLLIHGHRYDSGLFAMAAQYPLYGLAVSLGCRAGRRWAWIAVLGVLVVHVGAVALCLKG
jgi:hypothetical protein